MGPARAARGRLHHAPSGGHLIRRLLRGGELSGLVRDATLQGVAQTVTALGYLAQIALITHILGLREFGRYALVIAFVTLVQHFFDVRVEQATITFGIPALKEGSRPAAGVVQFSYLVDLGTGVVGFAVVMALAPFVGPRLVGADGDVLMAVFALTMLTSTVDGTSGSVLRLFDRYGLIVANAVAGEVFRLGFLGIALVAFDGLGPVFVALLLHDVAGAIVLTWLAARTFRRRVGSGLLRPALDAIRDRRRAMLRMVVHSNVIGYGRLAQAQLPPLVLGGLLGPLEVGIYKIGTTAGLALGKLSDPALRVILPRLSRLWADGRVSDLRKLVRQVTSVSIPVMLVAGGALVLFRGPALRLLGGDQASVAGTVLIIAAGAQAFASMFFWSGPLLLATGHAAWSARVQMVAVAVQIPLAIVLGRAYGAEGAALGLAVSYGIVVSGYTARAIVVLRRGVGASRNDPPPDGGGPAPVPAADLTPTYE